MTPLTYEDVRDYMFSILPAKICSCFVISETLTFRFVIISFSAVAIHIGFTTFEGLPDRKSSSRH